MQYEGFNTKNALNFCQKNHIALIWHSYTRKMRHLCTILALSLHEKCAIFQKQLARFWRHLCTILALSLHEKCVIFARFWRYFTT